MVAVSLGTREVGARLVRQRLMQRGDDARYDASEMVDAIERVTVGDVACSMSMYALCDGALTAILNGLEIWACNATSAGY